MIRQFFSHMKKNQRIVQKFLISYTVTHSVNKTRKTKFRLGKSQKVTFIIYV